MEGVRSKTIVVIGILPIMLGHGTGSEVMQRITAPLLSLFVVPCCGRGGYLNNLKRRDLPNFCNNWGQSKIKYNNI